MKRKLILFGCCIVALLTTIFTSCKQEVPVPEMVTISYVSKFGTLDKTEKIVEKGYKLKTEDLPILTCDGYTFGNWYIDTKEATVDTVIEKDTKLVAKWTDITAPGALSNFTAIYSDTDKTITLTWTEPTDSDYASVTITTNDANPKVFNKGTTTYVVSNIEPDKKSYTFKAVTKDDVGNVGGESTVTIVAGPPSITSLELSRTRLANTDPNQTIDVTIKGNNFNAIKYQADKTLLVEFYQGDMKKGESVTATINEADNTASATINAPKSEGVITFTVKAKLCGTYSAITKEVVVSPPAILHPEFKPTLSKDKISSAEVPNTSKVTFTGRGVMLDVLKSLKIGLYDSNNTLKSELVSVDTKKLPMKVTYFTADIPLPQNYEGVLTAKVLFDDVVAKSELGYPTLQIYGSPKFSSFSIPKAGTAKADTQFVAIVKGCNFTAPITNKDSFKLNCVKDTTITSNPKIEVVDDETLKVTLTIPKVAGDYEVTISSGSESKVGTFNVRDTSSYHIGDIIFSDNSIVGYESYQQESTKTPVAVVCGLNNGLPFGVGLKQSEIELSWAKENTTGYNTPFTKIICTPSVFFDKDTAHTATFTGDLDGSDNWKEICKVDPEGTQNAATNYPAFDWVNNYGEKYKLPEGYKNGWYMPSIYELTEYIYKNSDVIKNALKALGTTIANPLNSVRFWSSSQKDPKLSYYSYQTAWFLTSSNDSIVGEFKKARLYIRCIRAL